MMKTWVAVVIALGTLALGFLGGAVVGGVTGGVGGVVAGAPIGACLAIDEAQAKGYIDQGKSEEVYRDFLERVRSELEKRGFKGVVIKSDSCGDIKVKLDELKK